MPDGTYKSSPESTDPNALKIAILTLNHETEGEVKIPYGAIVDYPSYVSAVIDSAVGVSKNHVTFWNGSNRRVRIRKIELSANIKGNITGATIMISAEGLNAQPVRGTGTIINSKKLSTNAEDIPAGIEIFANPQTVSIATDYILAIKPLHVEEAVTTVGDSIDLFKKDTEISSIQLAQGQGITVKQGTLAGAGNINILLYWTLD
jgi:hypothetical protein